MQTTGQKRHSCFVKSETEIHRSEKTLSGWFAVQSLRNVKQQKFLQTIIFGVFSKNKMIALREHKGWNCKPAVRKDTVLRRVRGAWCNRYDVEKQNNDCYIQWFFVTIKKLMIAPCRLTTWTWKVKLQTPGQKRHSSSAKSPWCVAQSWRNVTQNKKSKLLHTIVFCFLCLLSPWLHHRKNRH